MHKSVSNDKESNQAKSSKEIQIPSLSNSMNAPKLTFR